MGLRLRLRRDIFPSWLGHPGESQGFQDRPEITKSFVHVFNLSNFGNPEFHAHALFFEGNVDLGNSENSKEELEPSVGSSSQFQRGAEPSLGSSSLLGILIRHLRTRQRKMQVKIRILRSAKLPEVGPRQFSATFCSVGYVFSLAFYADGSGGAG